MRANIRFGVVAGACLGVFGLVLCGCGGSKDPGKISSQYNQLFASADPDAKAYWDTTTAAMKTNGYAVGIVALRAMIAGGKLNDTQTKAAQETAKAISDRMYDAANKGEAAGLQAIEELRKASGR